MRAMRREDFIHGVVEPDLEVIDGLDHDVDPGGLRRGGDLLQAVRDPRDRPPSTSGSSLSRPCIRPTTMIAPNRLTVGR